MSRPFDRSILADFASEVRSEIPAIIEAVTRAMSADCPPEPLQEAHRLMHTIKGASAMVGLSTLSHLAHELECLLDRAVTVGPPLDGTLCALVSEAVIDFGAYVDARVADAPTHGIVTRLVSALRRFGHLPPDGDAAAVAALLHAGGEPSAASGSAPAELAAPGSSVDSAPARPAATALSGDETAIDVRPADLASSELADVFREESSEHLQIISRTVGRLRSMPDDREALQELRRSVHTLKGAAGMVGFAVLRDLAHRMEDLLDRLYDGTAAMTPEAQRSLFGAADAFDDLISGTGDDEALRANVRGLYRSFDRVLSAPETPAMGAAPAASVPSRPVGVPAAAAPAAAQALPPVTPARADQLSRDSSKAEDELAAAELRRQGDRRIGEERRRASASRKDAGRNVRVPFDRLDDVVKLVGELVINRSTFEQHFDGLIRQVDELEFSMGRLRRVAARLESEYGVRALGSRLAGGSAAAASSGPKTATFATHGFDELEFDRYTEFHLLSRELTETASDINTVGARLRDTITDFDGDLTRLARLTGEVQDKVMQFRMLPLATLTARLERTVRVTADDRGKLARLVIEGESVALDKSVLEEMSDPLLHLLRNAVDHGLEAPDVRRAAGKAAQGTVIVRAFYEGTQVVIQIQDDGAGLDVDRIRQTAVDKGLVEADAAVALSDQQVFNFIFAPGFTTASAITRISGRGVGMDIVRSKIERFNGQIRIASTPGAGTTFTVRLPMTLAIMRVLLVRAGAQMFAVPMGAILSIVKLGPDAIGRAGTKTVVSVAGATHPLVVLAEFYGLPTAERETPERPVLIVGLGDMQVAVAVDEILEGRDAVVKTLGAHLRRVHGFSGATFLGDGSVVLIVNPDDLAREVAAPRVTVGGQPQVAHREPYTVMVVDDSLSVRHVLSGLIKKAGWNVVQARDGVEALEILHRAQRSPDVILLDIEMPRMDGYELTSAVRGHAAHKDIPIIIITSRAGDKHRQKAMALGATEYMVKPFHDDRLLARIDALAKAPDGRGTAA